MTEETTREEIREQKLEELQATAGEDEAGGDDGQAASPSEPVHVNGADELRTLTADHDVVLVDFYADWCGPCKMLEPIVEQVAAETDAVVGKVDVDANQQLAGEYGVRGVPTLVLFADGEAVDEMVGVQQKEALVGAVQQYL